MRNDRSMRIGRVLLVGAFAVGALVAAVAEVAADAAAVASDPDPEPAFERLMLYAGDPPGEPTWDKPGPIPEMQVGKGGRLRFVHEPAIDVYHAKGEDRNGAAVVICPGGGYGILAYQHEGVEIARWLNRHGITGVILRYRMHPYRHPVPMTDVQRALQTVRANAKAWSLDPERIGVLGFSAGGHLASTATVHHRAADPDSDDPIERVSSRPDFSVLVYPVITLRPPTAHMGSRRNLLGPHPSEALLDEMSTEKRVDAKTPPTLLVHSKDDRAVPIGNSELFLEALKEHGVPGKLLAYETGGHGYGLGRGRNDPDNTHETDAWPSACIAWLTEIGVIGSSDGQ